MTVRPYQDWLATGRAAAEAVSRRAEALSAGELRRAALQVLGASDGEPGPANARVLATWEADGVRGERVAWDLGYGPSTEAYVLAPAGSPGPLPGIVALHCHGGFKYYGKDKIADGPEGSVAGVESVRSELYQGRAYANALARRGFVVLAHDVFMWGSRRFELEEAVDPDAGSTLEGRIRAYNDAAARHEHVIEKRCRLLGTTLAAIVAREDRAAVRYLAGRPDVRADRLGCIGLSGGGIRSALLHASSRHIRVAVVVAMMATYPSLLARHAGMHTWMLYPTGWSELADWPDLAGSRPSSPLLVQFDEDDHLFPPEGMQAAHQRLLRRFAAENMAENYEGRFYPGDHKFDLVMQEDAFDWLAERLGS